MKDRIHSSTLNHPLIYAVWSHQGHFQEPYDKFEVLHQLQTKSRAVYFITLKSITDVAAASEPIPLNTAYGGSSHRPMYGSGYRFRFSNFDLDHILNVSLPLINMEQLIHVYAEPEISEAIELQVWRSRTHVCTQKAELEKARREAEPDT